MKITRYNYVHLHITSFYESLALRMAPLTMVMTPGQLYTNSSIEVLDDAPCEVCKIFHISHSPNMAKHGGVTRIVYGEKRKKKRNKYLLHFSNAHLFLGWQTEHIR